VQEAHFSARGVSRSVSGSETSAHIEVLAELVVEHPVSDASLARSGKSPRE
jgi:hypothetical protein